MKIVSAAEYKAKGFRKLQEEAAAERAKGAQPAAPDVVIPDDMARASLALMSRVSTPTEELIEYRQERLDAMLAGDLTDDARTSLGYAAGQLERARYLHAKGAADVDIATVLEVIDLRLKDVVVVAAANKTTTEFKSEAGQHAVSHRPDQLLKEPWQDHVKACVARGDVIRNIKDLREGCPPKCKSVALKTLKDWAKEAVPGLEFKAGAQKGAVSRRHDPLLKEPWQDHVKACVARGDLIRNVDDLLSFEGYPPECSGVAPATLKKWAKEAVPGLKFKAGRPKYIGFARSIYIHRDRGNFCNSLTFLSSLTRSEAAKQGRFDERIREMTDTKPADFQSIGDWFAEHGKPVFPSVKMLYYHVAPVQKDLIEAGAMAKVGERIFLHKSRFWPEYQRIVASQMEAAR